MSATKTTTLNLLPLLCSVCMHQTVYEESVGVTSEIVTTSLSLSLTAVFIHNCIWIAWLSISLRPVLSFRHMLFCKNCDLL